MITVNKEDLVRNIRLMQDIDGYSEGDCVSRRSVLAVVNTLETYDIKALDAFVDDGKCGRIFGAGLFYDMTLEEAVAKAEKMSSPY